MEATIEIGKYKHYKGLLYFVYGIVNIDSVEHVLYQQEYGTKDFWARPLSMFTETITVNNCEVPRFELINKVSAKTRTKKLKALLEKSNIKINHSETSFVYCILSFSSNPFYITLAKYNSYSAYLSDFQLAHRLGFDLYEIDNDIYTKRTIFSLPENKLLQLSSDDIKTNADITNIAKNLNPCSIDIHISDTYFAKAKNKTIDLVTMMHFSTKASELWKTIHAKKYYGEVGLMLHPGQTIYTCTFERIKLPADCAGKIEIKSTYARLALSITTSDFCNPGWEGHFPLAIKNNSKHRIVIHPKEKMLQLILVSTDGQCLNKYAAKGTYNNDDGTPYKFWHSQAVKHIQKREQDYILQFYAHVLNHITSQTSNQIDDDKDRFSDTFLSFCEKELRKHKHQDVRDIKLLLRNFWRAYRRSEQRAKLLFSFPVKILSSIVTMLPSLITLLLNLLSNNKLSSGVIWFGVLSFILGVSVYIILHLLTPKAFCSFEKLEFDSVIADMSF